MHAHMNASAKFDALHYNNYYSPWLHEKWKSQQRSVPKLLWGLTEVLHDTHAYIAIIIMQEENIYMAPAQDVNDLYRQLRELKKKPLPRDSVV